MEAIVKRIIGPKGADFSSCGKYRYRLWRIWDTKKPPLVWILLNPSTADEWKDDPTMRRCCGFAQRDGYGGIIVLNIFAWRSTDPKLMKTFGKFADNDIIGPENNDYIKAYAESDLDIAIGWGTHGALCDRHIEVFEILSEHTLKMLGQTATGQPKHPLYISGKRKFTQALYLGAETLGILGHTGEEG